MSTNSALHKYASSDIGEFERIQHLVYKHTAIVISEEKKDFIRSRISKRLRELELDSLSEYCDYVESGKESVSTFTSQVTTNHTHFFRERHHFDALITHLSQSGLSGKVIWSSACSTGEEPYSIAISLLEQFDDVFTSGLKLLATDLDEKVLDIARNGVYDAGRLEPVSISQKQQCCVRGVGESTGKVRMKKPIRDLIEFSAVNLVEPLTISKRVNIIFCRNVIIYFDRKSKIKIFDSFAKIQESGDLLFIGHSESLNDISSSYSCIGNTIYRRN